MKSLVDGKHLAHRYFEELLSAPGDLSVADEILHPDVTFENPVSKTTIDGIPAYKRFVETWSRDSRTSAGSRWRRSSPRTTSSRCAS